MSLLSGKAVALDSPVRVAARAGRERSPWEVAIRYGAAYACTLISVSAAQLVLRTDIALMLAALCVAGLPLSLWLRRARAANLLRLAGHPVPRPLINAGVMLATLAVCGLVLSVAAPDLSRLLELSSATQTVSLLMQAFLIFGVCRCLAILTDKDAVLCAVPSFSVLLLLIVIHKGPEVVAYFALWAIASAVLLSLDFRYDVRRTCSAIVPGLAPNQELKLSARGLATVLGFSLGSAALMSYVLADDDATGPDQSWISNIAARLNGYTQDTPDSSVNGGPERQIDYSSAPSLPTRTKLWRVQARRTDNWSAIHPHYWRLFALSVYDGRTWSQNNGAGRIINNDVLGPDRWPLPSAPRRPARSYPFESPLRTYDIRRYGPPQAHSRYFGGAPAPVGASASRKARGAALASTSGGASTSWAAHHPREWWRVPVIQRADAITANTGFIPTLPGAEALRFRGASPSQVRQREDGSLDVGVMREANAAILQGELPPIPEMGFDIGGVPPLQRIEHPDLLLSSAEEQRYKQLPAELPARVRTWARNVLRASARNDSNYQRALRLSAALQEGSFYTLRPPSVPPNRDATDFFLFDSRRGYCTYFAGALAVTCRAADIPARVVSGFTNPEWQTDTSEADSAILRESGAHTWVEVWEPGWGWAMVDATPSESRGNNAPSLFQNWEDLRGILVEWIKNHLALLRLALPLSLLLLAVPVVVLRRKRVLRVLEAGGEHSLSPEDALVRGEIRLLYARATRRLSQLFRPRAAWETPAEWLHAALPFLNLRDEGPLHDLFEAYMLASFSPFALRPEHLAQARAASSRLSWAKNPKPKMTAAAPAHDA